MKSKMIIAFLVLLAFLGGMFIPKAIAMLRPPVWSQSLPVTQPSDPAINNSEPSSGIQSGGGSGGMWYSPMNPNYNPRYDWYTVPNDQYEDGRGDWCW